MGIKETLKSFVPESVKEIVRRRRRERFKAEIAALPPMSAEQLAGILKNDLGVQKGSVIFVHSALARLNLTFPKSEILPLILETIGEEGTVLFPTFPKLTSDQFLLRGEVFDIRNTPSAMGGLTEQARRHENAVRSFHPTKSVCAIGPLARELTSTHPESPYPFDACSPYYKMMAHNAMVIGIGASSKYLSFTHTVDDAMKERFPVDPYLPQLFEAPCIDYDGEKRIVKSYAHDQAKMTHDVVSFMAAHIPHDIGMDLTIDQKDFFWAKSSEFFTKAVELAENNITIFAKESHKPDRR